MRENKTTIIKWLVIAGIIISIGSTILVVHYSNALFESNQSTSSPPPVEHCLDVYSGGNLIWEGKAERTRTAQSDTSVDFINGITGEEMTVHTDFVYYVCHEVKEDVK